jgi:hypothetical protein
MKKILIYAALLSFTVYGCRKVERVSYSGVFKLEKQVIKGGERDTLMERSKIKIYTDYHYMYAGVSTDSLVRFGLGTYQIDTANSIDEHNIYNNRALDSTQIFVVTITKNTKGRTQFIPDFGNYQGIRYTLTEDYAQLPATAGISALDGVWEMKKVFWVKGKDTTHQLQTQFKLFWHGHFMFIHRYPIKDAGTEYMNGFGYGTFGLTGNTLTENEELSSHTALVNRSFAIKVTFNGKNAYTQVTTDPQTGIQTTEVYERLREGA